MYVINYLFNQAIPYRCNNDALIKKNHLHEEWCLESRRSGILHCIGENEGIEEHPLIIGVSVLDSAKH